MERNASYAQASVGICGAAVLCGSAMNTCFERCLSDRMGIYAGCLTTVLFSILGVSWIYLDPSTELLPIVAIVIGFGIGSDWSSVSELARRCLPTRRRWQGMRLWSVAFPAGAALSLSVFLLAGGPASLFYVAITLAVLILTLMVFATSLAPLRMVSSQASNVAAPSVLDSESPPVEADTNANDCDAAECCGGGVQEIVPTSFRHGVAVCAVGALSLYATLWSVLSNIFLIPNLETPSYGAIGVAIGLPAGAALIVSAAPRIGYAVALLPFLLASAVLPWLIPLSAGHGVWQAILFFSFALTSSSVAVGVSSIVGELFSDCPTDGKRSRIVAVAFFMASASLALMSLLAIAQVPASVHRTCLSAIFVSGLLWIRLLPNPVISTLGSDDDSDTDDEEFKDVLASLHK